MCLVPPDHSRHTVVSIGLGGELSRFLSIWVLVKFFLDADTVNFILSVKVKPNPEQMCPSCSPFCLGCSCSGNKRDSTESRFHGNRNVDKSWHENVDNVQIFPSADFTWLFCQCVFEINTFFWLPFQAPYGAVVLVRSLLMKNRKVISYVEEALKFQTEKSTFAA